ncbi:MAG: flippase [Thermodesulfobacteriota bacterium]
MTLSKHRIIQNVLSLSALQGSTYVISFLTIPYLVRVLGPEKFGLIAFAQALIQYFVIFTDYGFNFSASRSISKMRADMENVRDIFWTVITIKIIMTCIALLLLCALIFLIPFFKSERAIYFYTFGTVIGSVLFPVWFFQGVEDMKFITIFNIVTKLSATACIFIFIKYQEDYNIVPIINSIGQIVGGFSALIFAWNRFDLTYRPPTLNFIINQLKEGWHIFTSMIISTLYTSSNTIIIGILTNNTIVGYYSAAEKLIMAVTGLINPVCQAVYPHISFLVGKSKEQAIAFLSKLAYLTGIVTFFISIGLLILASSIVRLVLGDQFEASISVVKVLSFLPFIIGLSGLTGVITMFNFSMESLFSKVLLTRGILNVILAFALIPLYKQNGLAVSILITEIFTTSTIFYLLERRGVHIFANKYRMQLQ